MTIYCSDDFEDFPTDWIRGTANSGAITKSSEQKQAGTYSCKIYSPGTGDQAYAYKAVTEIVNVDYHGRIYVYLLSSNQPDNSYIFETRDGGVTWNIVAAVDYQTDTYYLRNYAPGGLENVCSLTADEWHKVDMYYKDATSKIKYYVDDVDQGEFDPLATTGDSDRIYIGDNSDAVLSGIYYLDELLIDDTAEPVAALDQGASIISILKSVGIISLTKPKFRPLFPKFKARIVI